MGHKHISTLHNLVPQGTSKERVGGNKHATANPNLTGKGLSAMVTVEPVERPVSYVDVVRGKSSE